MRFQPTDILGAWIVETEFSSDPRGEFGRTFCAQEFQKHGLTTQFPQSNLSNNRTRGTLRGLHFQADPKPEAKLLRCTRGEIFDVVLDLRPESKTYLRWQGVILSAKNRLGLYIPTGCAHGFQTLRDESDVFYQMSESYDPSLSRGVRWNDPAFRIRWPLVDPILSEKDASYPDWKPA